MIPITWIEALGWTLLHSLWQCTVVALLFGVLLRAIPYRKAAARYVIACAGLVLMLLWSTYTLIVRTSIPHQTAAVTQSPVPEAERTTSSQRARPQTASNPPSNHTTVASVDLPESSLQTQPENASQFTASWQASIQSVLPWLVAVWSIGVAVLSGRLLRSWFLGQALRRQGNLVDPVWQQRFTKLCEQLGIRQHVKFVHTDSTGVPMVMGCLKPIVLIPGSVLSGLSVDQVEVILVHELAHVRRHDYLVNLLQSMVETLFFYHPAVWWIGVQIRSERENCCDDVAAEVGGRNNVANALVALAEMNAATAVFKVAANDGKLLQRIKRLLRIEIAPRPVWPGLLIAIALLIGVSSLPAIRSTMAAESDNDIARALLRRWQDLEGVSSPIPDENLTRLRRQIDEWIRRHQPNADIRGSLIELRDWQSDQLSHSASDLATHLDKLAAIEVEILQWTFNGETRLGTKLSADQLDALAFGPIGDDGLRAAWSLVPKQDVYVLGDQVACQLTIQNAGDQPITVKMPWDLDHLSWNATRQDGSKVDVERITLSGSVPVFTWRLKPGEVIQIGGRGVNIGRGAQRESLGLTTLTTVEARGGDEITLTHKLYNPRPMETGPITFRVVDPEQVAVWMADRAGTWPIPGGGSLSLVSEVFHGADVQTRAFIRVPAADTRPELSEELHVASDFFANRVPWAVVWQRDRPVLWIANGEPIGPQDRAKQTRSKIARLIRLDLTSKTDSQQTEVYGHAGPAGFLPADVKSKLETHFDFPDKASSPSSQTVSQSLGMDVPFLLRERVLNEAGDLLPNTAVIVEIENRLEKTYTSSDDQGRITAMIRLPLSAIESGTRISFTQNLDGPFLNDRPRMLPIRPFEFSAQEVRAMIENAVPTDHPPLLTGDLRTPQQPTPPGSFVLAIPQSMQNRGLVSYAARIDEQGRFRLYNAPVNEPLEIYAYLERWNKPLLPLVHSPVSLRSDRSTTLDLQPAYVNQQWQLRVGTDENE